ncbi:MAG: hypothetical protein AAF202_00870 [Pseudomonadota bacterium]
MSSLKSKTLFTITALSLSAVSGQAVANSCAYNVPQLRGLFQSQGHSTSWASALLGQWQSQSSSKTSFHFLEYNGGMYLAGQGPLGADAQPLSVCSTGTANQYEIESQFNGLRVNILVQYSGGSRFEIVNIQPRMAAGLEGAYTQSSSGSAAGVAAYRPLLDQATR